MQHDKDSRCRPGFVIASIALIFTSVTCFAHPMGNFSINHYSKITIGQQSIEILYLVDMAEIPTYQDMRQFGVVQNSDDPSVSRYLEKQEAILKTGLSLQGDGHPVQLETIERRVTFAEGAGG